MKQSDTVAAITREFKAAADPEYRKTLQTFFKEPIQAYGVRTPEWRRISRRFWDEVKKLPKAEVFELCEELLAVGNGEERGVAFDWASRLRRQLVPGDFPRLERWLEMHVSNWGACDSFAGGALGGFLIDHPGFLSKARRWAKSENRWLRRASAVTLIPALKAAPGEVRSEKPEAGTQSKVKGQESKAKSQNEDGARKRPEAGAQSKYVVQAYETADILLLDKDDMVQKGYGWMLKELANRRPQEVFEFVMARKDRMPRTALRYAIEKMPTAWKKQAMAK